MIEFIDNFLDKINCNFNVYILPLYQNKIVCSKNGYNDKLFSIEVKPDNEIHEMVDDLLSLKLLAREYVVEEIYNFIASENSILGNEEKRGILYLVKIYDFGIKLYEDNNDDNIEYYTYKEALGNSNIPKEFLKKAINFFVPME